MSHPVSVLTEILDILPVGVVTLDRGGRVIHFNRTEERLANRSRERALGRDFFREIAPCMDVRDLAGVFRDGIGRRRLEESIAFSFAFPFLDGPRDVVVHLRSLEVGGVPYATLIIEDIRQRRAADRMQQTLADLIRQDMGSPIAGILAGCGFLLDDAPHLGGASLATVADIARGADQLQGMLHNLLDISRLEGGTMPITLARGDLGGAVGAAVTALQGYAVRRGVALELVGGTAGVEAMMDPVLMTRILDNLIQNAIAQAPRGGRVRVGALRYDARAAIEIHDDGPSIDPARLPLLFDRYSRVTEGTGRTDNRGLSLTFVQLAVRAHGGEVTVESATRSGTTFRVLLPSPDPVTDFMRIRSIDPSA